MGDFWNAARGVGKFFRNSTPRGAEAAVKSKGWMGKAGLSGMGVGMVGMDVIGSMSDGDSLGTAVVKGVADAALWSVAEPAMWAYTAATTIPQAATAGYDWYRGQVAWWQNQHLPTFGGQYRDTQRALTMRQAAVQAIQGSKMNARSALGGEAAIFNNYFNRA